MTRRTNHLDESRARRPGSAGAPDNTGRAPRWRATSRPTRGPVALSAGMARPARRTCTRCPGLGRRAHGKIRVVDDHPDHPPHPLWLAVALEFPLRKARSAPADTGCSCGARDPRASGRRPPCEVRRRADHRHLHRSRHPDGDHVGGGVLAGPMPASNPFATMSSGPYPTSSSSWTSG